MQHMNLDLRTRIQDLRKILNFHLEYVVKHTNRENACLREKNVMFVTEKITLQTCVDQDRANKYMKSRNDLIVMLYMLGPFIQTLNKEEKTLSEKC